MEWVVKATPRPLYPLERPGTHCTGGWMGPRADLGVCGKYRPSKMCSRYKIYFIEQQILCYAAAT
jgi:hypothetical protein